MKSKRIAVQGVIVAGALLASAFVAAQPAQAVSIACATGGPYRVCIGTLVNSSGTVIGYTSTACNISGSANGVASHVVLRETPQHFAGVTGDKVLYGTGGSTRTCLTITASTSRDSSTKIGSVGTPGSGFALAEVQNKLS